MTQLPIYTKIACSDGIKKNGHDFHLVEFYKNVIMWKLQAIGEFLRFQMFLVTMSTFKIILKKKKMICKYISKFLKWYLKNTTK